MSKLSEYIFVHRRKTKERHVYYTLRNLDTKEPEENEEGSKISQTKSIRRLVLQN
jgi:hypothetical protein